MGMGNSKGIFSNAESKYNEVDVGNIGMVRFFLSYLCYPIWLYDSNANLVKNGLPKELEGNKKIEQQCDYIQEVYDSLFANTTSNFSFKGFAPEQINERKRFFDTLVDVIEKITSILESKYIIKNDIDLSQWQ
jgi:hypothetical protein